MKVKYEKISETKGNEIQNELFNTVVDCFRKEKLEDGFYKYEVPLQEIRFVTAMTDEELKDSARLTIDLMEELKNINNNGFDKAAFEKVDQDSKNLENKVAQVLRIWNLMSTDELICIMYEIDSVRRVGGAWAMFISNPGLISAVVSVYDVLVDHFDDEELYVTCSYFLYRAVMKMHSNEIEHEK